MSTQLHRLDVGRAFVLSEAVLFTEANVVLPATLLSSRGAAGRVARFWTIAWIGNMLGAALLVAAPFWYAFRPTVGGDADAPLAEG